MYRLILLLGLSGCRGGCADSSTGPDCAAVRAEPGRAMELIQPHADTPADFWRHVETCFAPDGDACERAWVGLRAAPSMARPTPEEAARQEKAYLAACRGLPEAQQRCLQASYAIDHGADCAGARIALQRALERAEPD